MGMQFLNSLIPSTPVKNRHQIAMAIAVSRRTREQIAAEAGVSVRTLNRYEDQENLTHTTITKIDAALGKYVKFKDVGSTVEKPTVEPLDVEAATPRRK